MAEVAKLIRRHLPNVLTYLRPGITSAGLKTINAVLQWGRDCSGLPSTFTVEGSTTPHTQPGRAGFCSAPWPAQSSGNRSSLPRSVQERSG